MRSRGRAGSEHCRRDRRHRRRAQYRRGGHIDLRLSPLRASTGAAALEPRQRPGRVLSDGRDRGPARCRLPSQSRWSCPMPIEASGVNDRSQLAAAEAVLRGRINDRWMRRGVTMLDPAPHVLRLDGRAWRGRDSFPWHNPSGRDEGGHRRRSRARHASGRLRRGGAGAGAGHLGGAGHDRRRCPRRPLGLVGARYRGRTGCGRAPRNRRLRRLQPRWNPRGRGTGGTALEA